MQLTLSFISALPELSKSVIRELQWSIEWNQKQYSAASLHKSQAWSLYDEAIENHCSRAQIEDLFSIAMMFEHLAKEAWHNWQNAKRDYLALMN